MGVPRLMRIAHQAKAADVSSKEQRIGTEESTRFLKSTRKLAAIVYTEIVRYIDLSHANQELAVQLLDEHRKLLRPILETYEGREIRTIGDTFLVEFGSAVNAVLCAASIEQAFQDRNAAVSSDNHIRLRIGVHLGEVLESENDLIGDGVNIASRVQTFAANGGICLTQQVYDQVAGKVELQFTSLGSKALKDIPTPVTIFKVSLLAASTAAAPVAVQAEAPLPDLDALPDIEIPVEAPTATRIREQPLAEQPPLDVSEVDEPDAGATFSEPVPQPPRRQAAPAAAAIVIETPNEDDPAEKLEAAQRKAEMAEMKKKYSTESPMAIILSTEALTVEAPPASAGTPKYSHAAGKPLRESTLLRTLLKTAGVIIFLGAFGTGIYLRQPKNSGNLFKQRMAALSKAWNEWTGQPQMPDDPIQSAPTETAPATAEAPVVESAAPTAITDTTVTPTPTTEDSDSHGVSPQIEAMLLQKCPSDPAFCHRTGTAYLNDSAFESAAHFLTVSCEAKFGASCVSVGRLYANGQGVEKSFPKAVDYFEKGCALGEGEACASLGFAHLKGATGVPSPQKALDAFRKACEKDVVDACLQAGHAFKNGNGVDRAPAKANEFYSKACRLNDSAACEESKALTIAR